MGQLNRHMRLWSVATPIALAASLGFHAPAQESPAAALAQAEARWQEHGPKAYRFGINLTCFCDLRGMSFLVVDGLVQTPLDANAASRSFQDRFGTVEKLFAVIRRVQENGGHRIVVKYDSKLGYPIWADLDPRRERIDDELFFRVSGFRTLKPPTTSGLPHRTLLPPP